MCVCVVPEVSSDWNPNACLPVAKPTTLVAVATLQTVWEVFFIGNAFIYSTFEPTICKSDIQNLFVRIGNRSFSLSLQPFWWPLLAI